MAVRLSGFKSSCRATHDISSDPDECPAPIVCAKLVAPELVCLAWVFAKFVIPFVVGAAKFHPVPVPLPSPLSPHQLGWSIFCTIARSYPALWHSAIVLRLEALVGGFHGFAEVAGCNLESGEAGLLGERALVSQSSRKWSGAHNVPSCWGSLAQWRSQVLG